MSLHKCYDVVVVGGGIVGLATALQLLRICPDTKLALIEKESELDQHQTGHNSGVIHSGLYYKPSSLKAKNCREGYRQLTSFCQEQGVPYEICGKLVVATTPEELPRLETLYHRGIANGLEGLRFVNDEEIREIEPYCSGIKGLWVPQTGIVDYTVVTQQYGEKLRQLQAEIALNEQVEQIIKNHPKVEVVTTKATWKARCVVVCSGLQSDRLARQTDPDLPLRIIPFRGEYYQLKPEATYLVHNLLYPVPNPAFPFLGVHFTRLINGGVECGPNAVLSFSREGYQKLAFNGGDTWQTLTWPGFQKVAAQYWRTGVWEFYRSLSKIAFVNALQKLVPDVRSKQLDFGGAGIRAQACDRAGNLLDDFDIRIHQSVIHVCNAPSPAATSSLAIGKTVAKKALSLLD